MTKWTSQTYLGDDQVYHLRKETIKTAAPKRHYLCLCYLENVQLVGHKIGSLLYEKGQKRKGW